MLSLIARLRNHAAHTEPLVRHDYEALRDLHFHGGRPGFGALYTLVLVWQG
ncbi:MAG: hypothetical protein SNJ69_11635 [Chloroflexaceae bacterium]